MVKTIWLVIGVLAVIPLIAYAQRFSLNTTRKLLGRSLIIAAVIYVGFASVWGTTTWLAIEVLGIICYGLFYWLSIRNSILWLAAGWLFHPIWDIVIHLAGPGHFIVPEWYALACVSFDIAVAIYIVYRSRVEIQTI